MTRVERLVAAMGLQGSDAVIVYKPANFFYLTGFTGEGLALVSANGRAVVTDFRYVEQAQKECEGFEILSVQKGQSHEDIAAELCKRWQIKTLYYEDDMMTVRTFNNAKRIIDSVQWASLKDDIETLREVKDESEIALIAQACKITGDSLERILSQVREGMTERELAALLEYDMLSHGADGLAFSTIIAAGANGSLPHAVPSDYKIRRGDMITMDFGAKVGGYCADMTRTVAFGQPSDEMKRVYQTVQTAQQMSQDAVKAGVQCHDIDAIARDYIDAQGYQGRFGHGLGHSLGIEIHENPRFNQVSKATVKANQLMTVEPGIYLPGVGGVRIENTVVVLPDGCRPLTLPTKELLIL